MPKIKKMPTKEYKPAGMCPNLTKPVVKKRKKPNPYRAPLTVKRYYKGIEYGMRTLKEDLLITLLEKGLLTDEIKETIQYRTTRLISGSNKKLTELEKRKTKQKIKEWEEKEWESI